MSADRYNESLQNTIKQNKKKNETRLDAARKNGLRLLKLNMEACVGHMAEITAWWIGFGTY